MNTKEAARKLILKLMLRKVEKRQWIRDLMLAGLTEEEAEASWEMTDDSWDK